MLNVYVLAALPLSNVISTRLLTVVSTTAAIVRPQFCTVLPAAAVLISACDPELNVPAAPIVTTTIEPIHMLPPGFVVGTLPCASTTVPVSVTGPMRTRMTGDVPLAPVRPALAMS